MADAAESPSTLKSEPSSEPSSHLLGQIFPKSPTCCSSSSKSYLLHEDVALGKNADLVTPKCPPPPEDIVPSSPPPDSSSSTSFSLVESNSRPCGVELVCTARTNKKADPDDLVALAMQVQQADERTRSVAGSKLSVIAEQIQFLQQQAAKILEETRLNAELNHAACNMVKKPGTVYHLYQRDTGQKYLSILSPQEWGASCPHAFLGSYRLEYDMSWTPIDKRKERNSEEAVVTNILKAHRLVGPANAANHAQESSKYSDNSNFKPLMALLDTPDS